MLNGSCLCGGVRFEVTEPPVSASYCHCTRCQKRTGTAASPQARIVPGSLRITSGEELIRAYEPPDGFPKAFCSSVRLRTLERQSAHERDLGVRMSAFDDDPGVRPSYRQFVAYAAAWEPIPDDGLPRHPEGSSASARLTSGR